jgi:signal transduction histidine kinase
LSNVEKTFVSKDGGRIPVLFSASSMQEGDSARGFVCVAQDSTERRRAQQELARQAEELARSNAQLEHANVRLTQVDSMKSEFLSNVSHELRTPLSSIKAYAETLIDHASIPQEKRSGFTRIIVEQADRLTLIIDDLLDLAKIEAGKLTLSLFPVRIDEIFETAAKSLTPLTEKKEIGLDIEYPPELTFVIADEQRLVQVLINLINNASKFTEPRGTIGLSCVLVADCAGGTVSPGGQPACARITVSDTGSGIPPAELGRIFDKFKQVEDKVRGKPKGTGLGLAICRELVEKMGGRIWAESVVGKGSDFHFTLPLAREAKTRDGRKALQNVTQAKDGCVPG